VTFTLAVLIIVCIINYHINEPRKRFLFYDDFFGVQTGGRDSASQICGSIASYQAPCHLCLLHDIPYPLTSCLHLKIFANAWMTMITWSLPCVA
jgi:hypothetical protein